MARTSFISFLAFLILCAPTSTLAVGPYYLTNLGDLPGGTDHSEAYGINSQGQVVGWSEDGFGGHHRHAFLWTPTSDNGTTGSMISLGDLLGGAEFSEAYGINSQWQVVGVSRVGGGAHAFLWTPTTNNGTTGSMVDLGTLPGGLGSIAYDINSLGQVVGLSSPPISGRAFLWQPTVPNGTTGSMIDLGGAIFASKINMLGQIVGDSGIGGLHAFLWTPTTPNGTTGSTVDLGDLPGGFVRSGAIDINSNGQVVGWSEASTGPRAFLWTPTTPNGTTGSMVDIGDLPGGGNGSYAYGINSQGQVVGISKVGFGIDDFHAFVWTPTTPNGSTGVMLDLNNLLQPPTGTGWTLTNANEINDRGQIVGYGLFDPDGAGGAAAVRRGFLLTPVPEPATIVTAVFCTMLLANAIARVARRPKRQSLGTR